MTRYIRTQTHRLVYRPTGQCELYDLVLDPQELDNRYNQPAHAAVQQLLQTRILDWMVQTSDVTPFTQDQRGYAAA